MVGGNPQNDAYGFRYWNDPVSKSHLERRYRFSNRLPLKGAFAEFVTTGPLGRFEGFLGALWTAAFTIVGPEYLAMVAGEAKRPRIYLKAAFKTMYWRFAVFFIIGALCVGIIIPYNDPTLVNVLSGKSGGAGTAAASPYVIAMQNMSISVLPHITNALLVSSIFSAGNALTYCATRSLYGLALEGQAPKFLRKCTKNGVPIYCYLVTMLFPLLSFLQVSNGSAQVITWLANLVTAGQIINFIVMALTYIFFYRALKAQDIDRRTLPYYGWFQPYCGWIGLAGMIITVTCYGYTTFLPGYWDVGTFFSYYTMLLLAPLTFSGWKILKRTKFVPASQADLVWDRPFIDAYEATVVDEPTSFWREILSMVGLGRLGKKRTQSV